MRHVPSTIPSAVQAFSRSSAEPVNTESEDRHLMMRGVVHGVLLSLAAWAVIGYVAFALTLR